MDWIPIGEEVHHLTPNQKRIKDMLDAGKSILSICGIMRMRREHVVEEIYDIRKKEANMAKPNKLTNTQRAAIYQAYKDGQMQADLAKQYGVTPATISILIKNMRETEESMAAAVDLPAAAQVPAPEPERKAAVVNQDFENAIDKMIADANAEKNAANAEEKSANAEVFEPVQDPAHDLEDCENGIPNTPLDPITKEPEPLPPVVLRAVNQHLLDINDRIEQLQGRVDEIKMEIEEWQKDAEKLRAWRDEQTWK